MKTLKPITQRLFSLLFFLFFLQTLFSQTPPPDLNGSALRTWLKQNYYDGKHTTLGYNNARMYMYNYIDNHNNTITGVYSGYQVNWTYGGTGTNPAPINCEHTVPQSFFGSAEPMKSDIHHLFPSYQNWNSTRSNYPFAEINDNVTAKWMYLDQSQTTIPSSNIELYSEYANSTFEPREDHKGDCARAIFYFYTMYPTQAGDISTVADPNTLYQWHLADPVSASETTRNNEIETYQGDRNPYVDQPDLVAKAWGFTPTNPTIPSTPVLSLNATASSIDLIWNDVSTEDGYKLYRSTDGTNYILLSNLLANSSNFQDNAVNSGILYYYYILAYNAQGNSNNSNIVNGQLQTSGGGNATDLFLSEYIEGSSYNKALEIANFTGSTVNLSSYSIMKQTNGAGSWGSELILSGSLTDGDVYVIGNTSAGTEIQAVADLLTSSQTMSFNGNDPVALFKNGQLIDVIGNFNNASNYAKDVTLVRVSSVNSPNSSYTVNEWDTYGTDTFSYLGSHTMDGGAIADTEAPSIPSGLTASNITETTFNLSWNASTDNIGVTGYDVFKDGILYVSTANTSYNITGLTGGLTYAMTVKAKDAAGNISSASTALNATTTAPDIEAPSIPNGLLASSITETTFNLSWNASTDNVGVTGYDIYKNGSYLASSASTTYNVSGLSAWSTYAMTIKAKDAAGNISASSTVLNVTTTDITAPTTPSGLTAFNITETTFTLNWNSSTDNVAVTDYDVYQDGSFIGTSTVNTYDISGLSAGLTYAMTVIANDAAGNASLESNSLFVTTFSSNPGSGPATDLIISEYIEGSSYNKALEIANFTGTTVDLSNYSVMKQTNGAGSWGSELLLSGTIADGQVYVIVNLSAGATLSAAADLLTSSQAMTFNGNDPVGLFKNSALLDVVGIFNNTANYGKDVTMVRNSSVTSPSTTYNSGNWTVYATDEFSYIGSHTMNGASSSGPVELLYTDFENGFDIWKDGGGDCSLYSRGTYATQGSNAADIQDNSGTSSSFYLKNGIDIQTPGYTELNLDFNFIPVSMENGEDFFVEYFDGTVWNIVASFARGTDFSNNNQYSVNIPISNLDYNFPTDMKIRFRCDASGNKDDIYIDEIRLTASTGSTLKSGGLVASSSINYLGKTIVPDINDLELDVNLYPSPATDFTNLTINFEENLGDVIIQLIDLQGRIVYSEFKNVTDATMQLELDVSQLDKGIYLVTVNNEHFNLSKKLIIQ